MMSFAAIKRRVSLMIGRCVINAARADGGRVLVSIDALDDESASLCEWAEPTGVTSPPLPGAEGVALAIMGDRGHRAVLPLGDRRHRPTDIEPGEVSVYDQRGGGNRIDVLGDRIRITAPQHLEIVAPSATINGRAIATVDHEVEVLSGSSAGRWPIVTGVGDGG